MMSHRFIGVLLQHCVAGMLFIVAPLCRCVVMPRHRCVICCYIIVLQMCCMLLYHYIVGVLCVVAPLHYRCVMCCYTTVLQVCCYIDKLLTKLLPSRSRRDEVDVLLCVHFKLFNVFVEFCLFHLVTSHWMQTRKFKNCFYLATSRWL